MWIDPIFDRIQSDLDLSSGKGYLNFTDLNRIEGNCKHLKEQLTLSGYSSLPMTFKTWAMADFPYPDEINRIRNNVKGVANSFYSFAPTIVFHNTLNFTDVNTLEELMDKVNNLIELMIQSFTKKSGTFQSGQEVIL